MSSEIDTPAKRARLEARRNPYWQGVAGGRGGVTLGYRRAAGGGTWVAKVVIEKRRVEERIGVADDKGTADGMPFKQAVSEALAWGRRQVEAFEARDESQRSAKAPTVRSAIEAYVKDRLRRGRREGRDAERRLTKHVLSFPALADLPLAKLRAKSLERWRDQLAIREDDDAVDGLRPATVNRMMNDLRAALNSAVERHRRELPAHVMLEVKIGTRSLPSATRARKQSLTDEDIAELLREAWALDEDFGRLVLVLASTGCRYSQAAKIRVGDVQEENGRILVPCSAKGQGAKGAKTVAVPVSPDVLHQLRPAIDGRSPGEFLLTHWHLKQVGPGQWVREKRSAWKQNEMTRPWAKVREAAGFDADVVAYGLRHASIIRGLKAGLPIRLVAALHNTSSAMIEQHYGAYILDMSEELARRAMVDFGSRSAEPLAKDLAA